MAWGKLGSTTLGSAGDDLDITSMTASKFNQILYHTIPSGATDGRITYNNNSNSVYARRGSNNGGTDFTATGVAYAESTHTTATDKFSVSYLCSISGEEKLQILSYVDYGTAGAGTAPNRLEFVFKFVPSPDADITRIDMNNTQSGSFDTSSNLTALGSDITPAAAITFPTDVQAGSRAEITDTRKMYHYGDYPTVSDDFSSTSGWTQNDSAKIGLDTSNDKLDFNIVLVGNDNAYRAITTGSTTWVMRYLLRFSTISTSSGSNIYFLVDISDDGTTAGNNFATGSIGLYMNADESSNNSLDLYGNGATSDEIFVPVVNTDYYVEVIKTSATTATATVGTDAYGGTANGGSGSITGLTASTAQDTFAVRNRGTSSGSSGHSIIGYIKNFQYYNGVTSAGNEWKELGT